MDKINLPAPSFEARQGDMTVMEALKGRYTSRHWADKPLTQQTLAELLWAMYGINRPASGHRTAPSAMALYPLVLYVFDATGVYRFNPVDFTLEKKVDGDHRAVAGKQDYVAQAPVSIVVYADFSRLTNDDPGIEAALRQQAVVSCALDTGACTENGALYAASHGLNYVTRLMVDPMAVARLVPEVASFHYMVGVSAGYRPEEDTPD